MDMAIKSHHLNNDISNTENSKTPLKEKSPSEEEIKFVHDNQVSLFLTNLSSIYESNIAVTNYKLALADFNIAISEYNMNNVVHRSRCYNCINDLPCEVVSTDLEGIPSSLQLSSQLNSNSARYRNHPSLLESNPSTESIISSNASLNSADIQNIVDYWSENLLLNVTHPSADSQENNNEEISKEE